MTRNIDADMARISAMKAIHIEGTGRSIYASMPDGCPRLLHSYFVFSFD